jgi:hypothetical protein
MIDVPRFREISERNALIRYIWDNRNPYENAESITRLQRKIIEDNPEMDTTRNIAKRANHECAIREFINEN